MLSDNPLIMALDQGTTSSRALIFDRAGSIVASAQQEFEQHFPADGWVEHNPDDIWKTILSTAQSALHEVESAALGTVTAIGITNQRETTIIWDRETGIPVTNALVWQDRRTSELCQQLVAAGHEPLITSRTGLLLDPYFSATKIAWILDHVDGARQRAERGELAFGTVDTFLLWNLTRGRSHLTDETNASRTSLFNIHTGAWDADLLNLFNVPASLLPDVMPSAASFGETDPALFGRTIPICAMAGDQQAAAYGQGCTKPGMVKVTYGTGCFVLMNTGHTAIQSDNRLLTTRACRVGGPPVFALEGSIFIAGAVAQWLRDELQIIDNSSDSEKIASTLAGNNGVYMVPAFTGLGAPHWDSKARGAIYGLTRQSGRAEIVRAALEAVAYQTHDLFRALAADGVAAGIVRADGGMSLNNWLMQFVSDIADVKLERPENVETTALGAACLAGLQA
ncbi:MAG: glycerol kinase GlpK, partial [Henriciella sp.]|nr:glycerol kinase GlpK [Henriciella sp.]